MEMATAKVRATERPVVVFLPFEPTSHALLSAIGSNLTQRRERPTKAIFHLSFDLIFHLSFVIFARHRVQMKNDKYQMENIYFFFEDASSRFCSSLKRFWSFCSQASRSFEAFSSSSLFSSPRRSASKKARVRMLYASFS